MLIDRSHPLTDISLASYIDKNDKNSTIIL